MPMFTCPLLRRPTLGAVVLLTLAQASCDPCSGVARCSRGAYLAVNGQIVDPIAGTGLDGVRIDVVRVGGLLLDTDSVTTMTSDGGHWRVDLSPRDAGAVQVDVVVSPPGFTPYRVRNVTLVTRAHGGDANVLDRWVPEPYFAFAGEFFRNGTVDERVTNVPVEFRRTSGVPLRGAGFQSGTYRTVTDFAGRIAVFPTRDNAVLPVTLGEVVGDFHVELGTPYGTTIIRDVRLAATPVYRLVPTIIRVAVGPPAP